MDFDLKGFIQREKEIIDHHLDRWLPKAELHSAPLFEAMKYSVTAGGKRLRPILVRAGARAVGGDPDLVIPAACAIEFIHTYSLIHDDLPAMDDDDLRRGRPTCHKVFGDAIAILAGDGLLTLAFDIMSAPWPKEPPLSGKIEAISILAKAAGVMGMVGGQTCDILMEGKEIDSDVLHFIHRRKTGALITASLLMGATLCQGPEELVNRLKRYGDAVGHAFQIVDDILDIEGDQEVMGKPVGSDEKKGKATYPGLYGLETSKLKARELVEEAHEALTPLGPEADPLRAIASYITTRKR